MTPRTVRSAVASALAILDFKLIIENSSFNCSAPTPRLLAQTSHGCYECLIGIRRIPSSGKVSMRQLNSILPRHLPLRFHKIEHSGLGLLDTSDYGGRQFTPPILNLYGGLGKGRLPTRRVGAKCRIPVRPLQISPKGQSGPGWSQAHALCCWPSQNLPLNRLVDDVEPAKDTVNDHPMNGTLDAP